MEIDSTLKPGLAAISGGLGDIGRVIAIALARAGSDIAIGDIKSEKEATALSEEIHALGRRCFYAPLDVSNPERVSVWYDEVSHHFGFSPNLIVSNAATVTLKSHLNVSSDEWSREININLNGSFFFTNAGVKRLLKKTQPGRVVFIGSWAAHAPHRELPAYSVAKAGQRMLMKTLALEVASNGILVNEVAPGYVDAGLSADIFKKNPELADKAKATVPIKKLITPDEVAGQVLFLCSAYASQMTGTTLLQDGGLSLLQGDRS